MKIPVGYVLAPGNVINASAKDTTALKYVMSARDKRFVLIATEQAG